jgi:hypothetical protein
MSWGESVRRSVWKTGAPRRLPKAFHPFHQKLKLKKILRVPPITHPSGCRAIFL